MEPLIIILDSWYFVSKLLNVEYIISEQEYFLKK